MWSRVVLVAVLAVLAVGSAGLAGCADAPEPPPPGRPATLPAPATAPPPPAPPPTATPTPAPAQPGWVVGARPLPLRPDGFGQVLPTPPELVNRRLPTPNHLPPPATTDYQASVSPVPPDVLARSTWHPGCPVRPEQLRYLRMSFLGFDGRVHTGEMLVHADVAEQVTDIFGRLYAARFPIEEMRVVAAPELDLAPTGDGNNTSAFVCRPARGQTRWSAHAYGLAIDLNPFHNPYQRADLVLPELASAYLARDEVRPGMVLDGEIAVAAFEKAGWTWGGRWRSPRDYMHFSVTGD